MIFEFVETSGRLLAKLIKWLAILAFAFEICLYVAGCWHYGHWMNEPEFRGLFRRVERYLVGEAK